MIRAIAIDDEPVALEVIRSLSGKVIFLQVEAYFTNVFEAAGFLQENKVDLIFLDIKMPEMSGIDFMKSLPDAPLIIFTTAYSEHAVQSFELDATDYLLKPFSLARFLKACNKAHSQLEYRKSQQVDQAAPSSFFVKSGYEQVRIETDDIVYAESKGNYVQFVTEKQKILSRLTMSEVEKLLPSQSFIRIHRSFIVAKNKVSKMDKRSVWIKQTELPIGSGYSSEIDKLTG